MVVFAGMVAPHSLGTDDYGLLGHVLDNMDGRLTLPMFSLSLVYIGFVFWTL